MVNSRINIQDMLQNDVHTKHLSKQDFRLERGFAPIIIILMLHVSSNSVPATNHSQITFRLVKSPTDTSLIWTERSTSPICSASCKTWATRGGWGVSIIPEVWGVGGVGWVWLL